MEIHNLTLINNRYELQQKISDGMMGPVIRGVDTVTGKQVAVKILQPERFADHPELEIQFEREGVALRQLNHPNIVHFSDFFQEDGTYYLVIEFIEGGSLNDYLKTNDCPLEQVLEIGLDLADALARAHRLGIIHRDVKPQNILLEADGTPRLCDFGVAYYMRQPKVFDQETAGTVAYMPPESLVGKPADERTDIWSLGVVLFEMLTGRLPFAGKDVTELVNQILTMPLPNLRLLRPGLPPALYRLVELMLVKEPRYRIASVRLVGAALEAIYNGREAMLPIADQARFRVSKIINIPQPATSFIGREKEQLEIIAQLDMPGGQLLTLVGPGGVGKTRLAIQTVLQLYDRYDDGIVFVDLAPITVTEMVIKRIAEVLEIRESGTKELSAEIFAFCTGKRMMLILDNFEQVISASSFINDLHLNAPQVDILVTSREPLRLSFERVYSVQPLSIPGPSTFHSPFELAHVESVNLFLQRAADARPDFELTWENARDIAEICMQLDGLPLAIELAAARINILSPHYLLQELHDVFGTLTSGPRDKGIRHQTLKAAIDWSFNLLSDPEKQLFARLSVFQGGRSLAAVEKVCMPSLPINMLDGLTSLVSKNMLMRGTDVQGEPRFVFLETIHEYARQRLEESGEGREVKGRHAIYFVELVERIVPNLRGADQEHTLKVLRTEYDNIRVALSWTFSGDNIMLGLRLAAALADFWYYEGANSEGKKWMSFALEQMDKAAPNLQVRLLNGASLLAFIRGEHEIGNAWNEAALEIANENNFQEGAAWALFWMSAHAMSNPINYEQGIMLCEQALLGFEQTADSYGLAWGYNQIGELSRLLGRYTEAKDAYLQALEICRQTGNLRREAIALVNLGYVAYHQGEFAQAESYILEGLALLYHLKLFHHSTIALASLCGPVAAQGHPKRATILLGASSAAFERMAIPQQPADQMEVERYLTVIKTQLKEEEFKDAWSTGQRMTFEDAVTYAFLKEASALVDEEEELSGVTDFDRLN